MSGVYNFAALDVAFPEKKRHKVSKIILQKLIFGKNRVTHKEH
jgi:hypothetical protein